MTTPSPDYRGLIERLEGLSGLEPGWYANVGKQTGEKCCAAMRESAAAIRDLEADRERWHSAYEIAHDQATANGGEANRLRAALQSIVNCADSFTDCTGDEVAGQVRIRARQALSGGEGDGGMSGVRNPNTEDWTPARTARLIQLQQERKSASQIAKELGGTTRCAVIGKLSRLGLHSRGKKNLTSSANSPNRGVKTKVLASDMSPPEYLRPRRFSWEDASP